MLQDWRSFCCRRLQHSRSPVVPWGRGGPAQKKDARRRARESRKCCPHHDQSLVNLRCSSEGLHRHTHTHIPYNGASDATTLDYVFVSALLADQLPIHDVVDLPLLTDHKTLTMFFRMRSGKARPRQGQKRGVSYGENGMIGMKQRLVSSRRCYARLHGRQWRRQGSVATLGAASARFCKKPGHGATPFDDCVTTLEGERRQCKDKEQRNILTRCIFAARRFRSKWRFDKRPEADTARGRSYAKQQQSRPGLFWQGPATVADRREAFKAHWTSTMRQQEETPEAFMKQTGV